MCTTIVPGMFSSKVSNIYIYIYYFILFTFGSKINIILQLGTIFNNEAVCLEFFSDFWHGG